MGISIASGEGRNRRDACPVKEVVGVAVVTVILGVVEEVCGEELMGVVLKDELVELELVELGLGEVGGACDEIPALAGVVLASLGEVLEDACTAAIPIQKSRYCPNCVAK